VCTPFPSTCISYCDQSAASSFHNTSIEYLSDNTGSLITFPSSSYSPASSVKNPSLTIVCECEGLPSSSCGKAAIKLSANSYESNSYFLKICAILFYLYCC